MDCTYLQPKFLDADVVVRPVGQHPRVVASAGLALELRGVLPGTAASRQVKTSNGVSATGAGVPLRDHVDVVAGVLGHEFAVIFAGAQIVFVDLFVERGSFDIVRDVQVREVFDFSLWRYHSFAWAVVGLLARRINRF